MIFTIESSLLSGKDVHMPVSTVTIGGYEKETVPERRAEVVQRREISGGMLGVSMKGRQRVEHWLVRRREQDLSWETRCSAVGDVVESERYQIRSCVIVFILMPTRTLQIRGAYPSWFLRFLVAWNVRAYFLYVCMIYI
jgi:hypothetical protein